MKYLIASDIHGSAQAAGRIAGRFEASGADKLLLLGDFLYHGPRNRLPEGHDCEKAAEILNGYSDRIIAVRGNCDAEVDQVMLKFSIMSDYAIVEADGLTMFLTHGHVWGPGKLPPLSCCNVLLSGHTHVPVAQRQGDIFLVNPGSAALPRGGFKPTYCLYENGVFTVTDFDGGTIFELNTR